MLSRLNVLMATVLATALCSCGPEVVPTTGPHPATAADSVKIYQTKPHRYEDLGFLELPITPDLRWDSNGDANAAFDQMKAKAAALGANGLLLEVDPAKVNIFSTAGYHSVFYQVPMNNKTALAEAIYVVKE